MSGDLLHAYAQGRKPARLERIVARKYNGTMHSRYVFTAHAAYASHAAHAVHAARASHAVHASHAAD